MVLNKQRLVCFLKTICVVLAGGLLLTGVEMPAAGQVADQDSASMEAAAIKVCSSCHTMQIVMNTPRDYDAWHDTVQAMLDRGARGTPEELDLVMQYLFANVTTIDVNHADLETLIIVLRASPQIAEAIVARRSSRPFRDLADLKNSFPSLEKTFLDEKKGMIYFQ